MKSKASSKKKILIAASLLGVFLIGAIVSIVLVLAANTQGVASNITVTYNAEGVGAKVSATYAIVPVDTSASVSKTAMTTSSGGQEITFNLSTAQTTETISPDGNIELDPQNLEVVFEYVFENLAESAFSIELTGRPTGVNMTETYYVSGTRLTENQYRTRITKTTLAPQALTSLGQKVYIYIMASVTNENLSASYNGGFAWSLVARNTINITLNTDGATSTLKVIPNTITGLEEIAMPVLNKMPTKTDYNFDGYYTEDDTQYINSFGTSVHAADLAANTVLYAGWNQETLVIEDNIVYGLTDVGKTATTLDIPEGTTAIGEGALSGSSLTSVTIPNSVETIGNEAFSNSTNLETVTIGVSAQTAAYADGSILKAIGRAAFYGCSKLESIEFPYVLGDGTSSVNAFSKLFGTSNSAIPSTLTTVVLNGGTSIGKYAFYNCSSLTSVSIPSSVTSIGNFAFYTCNKLTEVNITSLEAWCNITFANNSANPAYSAEGLRLNGTILTEIEIPNTVTEIKSYTFYNCSSLTSITIPNSVTSIGNYAFYGCSGLTSISIPSSVTSIGDRLFDGCSNLTYNTYNNAKYLGNSENPYMVLIAATSTSITSCEINANTKIICDSAFRSCSKLTSITIPSSVTSIGDEAFSFCSRLVQVRNLSGKTMSGYTVPSYAEVKTDNSAFSSTIDIGSKYAIFTNGANKVLLYATDKTITSANDIPSNITAIGNSAFDGYFSLTSINIPEGVTSIGSRAFYGCSGLKIITIPSSVTSIGSSAFSSCSEIISITFAANSQLTSIGDAVFGGLTKLTSITIPSGVTSIGDYAFWFCFGLTSVSIPSSVTSIGYQAFYGCSKLTSVTFENPNGWWYSSSSTATSGTSIASSDLTNTTTAATYLTRNYSNYYWKRTA